MRRAPCLVHGAQLHDPRRLLVEYPPSLMSGGLLQLRALDWGTDNPLRAAPALIVFHPAPGDGHAFSILSWKGFVGAMTGYSHWAGVSEKKWYEDAPLEVSCGLFSPR